MSVMANMENILRTFGSFNGSRFDDSVPGVALFDGGTDSAYENYALALSSKKTLFENDKKKLKLLIAKAFDFFGVTGRPHIWPLFPGLPDGFEDELESRGAVRGDVFFGMTCELGLQDGLRAFGGGSAKAVVDVVAEEDVRGWADAVWYGFDSEEAPPESFVRFVREASRCGAISLIAIEDDELADACLPRRFSATGMLFFADGEAGLYYIATRPERRGRGLGGLVVRRLIEAAKELGCKRASLLATPQGRPLYARYGFKEECEVPICVFGE